MLAFEILEEIACFQGLIDYGKKLDLAAAGSVTEGGIEKARQQVEIQLQYINGLMKLYRDTYPESAWHFPAELEFQLPDGWSLRGELVGIHGI